MIYMENREIDWTGVKPLDIAIEPLTSQTFVERLNRLSAQANALRALRKAFVERENSDTK